MSDIVYAVMSQRNDEIDLEGIFSTELLAKQFIADFVEKDPDYSNEVDNWRTIWVKPVRIDEEITKITYPTYQIEYEIEDGEGEWTCRQVNRGQVYSLLGVVDYIDDENDVPYNWYVYLSGTLEKEEIEKVGKRLINEFRGVED